MKAAASSIKLDTSLAGYTTPVIVTFPYSIKINGYVSVSAQDVTLGQVNTFYQSLVTFATKDVSVLLIPGKYSTLAKELEYVTCAGGTYKIFYVPSSWVSNGTFSNAYPLVIPTVSTPYEDPDPDERRLI